MLETSVSMIVPCPMPSLIDALTELLRMTSKVSVPSGLVSFISDTVTVLVRGSPGANVIIWLVCDTKSVATSPTLAVPLCVLHEALTVSVDAALNETVNVATPSFSFTVMSLIDTEPAVAPHCPKVASEVTSRSIFTVELRSESYMSIAVCFMSYLVYPELPFQLVGAASHLYSANPAL